MKKINFIFAALVFFAGCSSSNVPVVEHNVNYTQSDAVENELDKIQTLLEENNVKALWRISLVLENIETEKSESLKTQKEFSLTQEIENKAKTVFEKCTESVVESYANALNEQNYFDAIRYFKSLQSCGYKDLGKLKLNEKQLVALAYKDVPGLGNTSSSGKAAKVSDMIKGTVTVYVDKGIKVQNGIGTSDGVLGSGFFISKDGYIVTNHHVIEDCVSKKYEGYSRLYIKIAEDPDTKIPAKVVGYDSLLDLALLKTEIDAPYVFTLGSSSSLDVGDRVYAIGSPLGLERTLTSGIVSAKDRQLLAAGSVFQIDAAVNSGNSGGPLIDQDGNVQAVVFAGVQNYQGLNFAIPVEYLKYELPYLYSGGERIIPWTGSYGKTKKMSGSGTKNEGLLVNYVMPGGSSYRSGISENDVIISFDGKKITSLEDFQCCLMMSPQDVIVKCGVLDENENVREKLVYLEKRPENPGYEVYTHDIFQDSLYPVLGMKLVSVSSNLKKCSVVSVIKGSAAEDFGFSEGDPVEVINYIVNKEKSMALIEIYAKKRKSGFLDVSVGLTVPLDSPYYF